MADFRGRRPEWNDYKKLQQAVEKYFAECAETDDFPDFAGMLLYLRIDKDDAKAMCEAEDGKEYRRIFKTAELRRESWLARHMVTDNKRATGCMNALKQMENGGYQDKNVQKSDSVLRIKVDGLKGGLESMK